MSHAALRPESVKAGAGAATTRRHGMPLTSPSHRLYAMSQGGRDHLAVGRKHPAAKPRCLRQRESKAPGVVHIAEWNPQFREPLPPLANGESIGKHLGPLPLTSKSVEGSADVPLHELLGAACPCGRGRKFEFAELADVFSECTSPEALHPQLCYS